MLLAPKPSPRQVSCGFPFAAVLEASARVSCSVQSRQHEEHSGKVGRTAGRTAVPSHTARLL